MECFRTMPDTKLWRRSWKRRSLRRSPRNNWVTDYADCADLKTDPCNPRNPWLNSRREVGMRTVRGLLVVLLVLTVAVVRDARAQRGGGSWATTGNDAQ